MFWQLRLRPHAGCQKETEELHQAWVLVELFLQGPVLERGQLLVAVKLLLQDVDFRELKYV